MSISAEIVRKLREETGAGMMDCKSALVEANGRHRRRPARSCARRASPPPPRRRAAPRPTASSAPTSTRARRSACWSRSTARPTSWRRPPDFQALVKDIAMHVAAASPAAALYVAKEEVPAAVLEKEKEIYRAQAAASRASPRPSVDKIAEGKLKEYYATFCLLEQPFVKDPKLTVGQLVQEKIALIKENIVVRRFARFRVGEESAREAGRRVVVPIRLARPALEGRAEPLREGLHARHQEGPRLQARPPQALRRGPPRREDLRHRPRLHRLPRRRDPARSTTSASRSRPSSAAATSSAASPTARRGWTASRPTTWACSRP